MYSFITINSICKTCNDVWIASPGFKIFCSAIIIICLLTWRCHRKNFYPGGKMDLYQRYVNFFQRSHCLCLQGNGYIHTAQQPRRIYLENIKICLFYFSLVWSLYCSVSIFIIAPLVNIKKAISQIKSEITGMDVRVGVLEHSLLQARLRDKNLLQQDMNTLPHVLV